MKTKTNPSLGVLTFVAAAGLLACKPAPAPVADVRPVRTVTVAASPAKATLTYAGEVRARYESSLAFRVGGKMVSRQVNVGERVKQGQVLARLDPQDLQLGDAAAQAQVAAAQSQLNVTRNDLERIKGLFAKGYASQGELDRYTTQFEAARAQFEAAQAQRNQVANQARYSTLVADVDGTVTAVLAEAGQVVAAGQPVFQLAKNGEIEVAAAVPEDQINNVKVGLPVTVSLWASEGQGVPGVVRELSSAADPLTRTYALRVSVPQPPPDMRLRMTASVAIPLAGLPTLVHLPSPAIVVKEGKAGVWVVDRASSTVQFRPTTYTGVDGNEILISAGVSPGDVVVTAGAGFLHEGQSVKLMGEAAAASPPETPAAKAPATPAG